ncbi:putative phage abortive infection protein [Pseudomonas fulva]|uniref:putative phage abortive infection protein n=1 Tax=Pseudomonas fulva TaxID=47880 RepID=UPI000F7A576F|nr:putative phage abortive infection protein [Pseudomonas fulva]MBA1209639.1 hypothetical protein [Pseudomonas fulva]MBA1217730.1 hypothetical protein [Pseudomonas fulva]MDH0573209.1 putative phage abortive infection protein [Pseudomonas fulva]RRW53951.1 hypothetical protein EGJ51_23255 [Pseudomonas fulva]
MKNRLTRFFKVHGVKLGVLAIAILIGFLLLLYRFKFGDNLSGEKDEWGQFGDYFGGVLNPILSFCALIAVLYSIRSQSGELALQRDQTAQQSFESVFFNLLKVFNDSSQALKVRVDDGTGPPIIKDEFRLAIIRSGIESCEVGQIQEAVQKLRESVIGLFESSALGYASILEQLLSCIDGYASDEHKRYRTLSKVRYSELSKEFGGGTHHHQLRERYSVVVRASMNEAELKCFYVYCGSGVSTKLSRLVCGYELFKSLPDEFTEIFGPHLCMYDQL